MKKIYTLIRSNVSPAYLAGVREKFIPLEYLKPRQYNHACRYRNLRQIQDSDTGKIYHETWFQKFIDESSEDSYTIVTQENANRLDIISQQFYSTPKFWWVVALANNIIDPFDIPEGTRLRIPPTISLYNEGGVLSGN